MSFDLNDVLPATAGGLIPDGTSAKVTMLIRPGGLDGAAEIDRGLLKRSGNPDSDVVMLDAEFTVREGPFARRKFWHSITVSGGKVDETGLSIGAGISKVLLRGMVDSAHGLDPADISGPAREKRALRGFADLDGITFIARIKIEASRNPAYSDRNRLERAIVPTEPEWRKVMNGETVSARPSGVRTPSAAPAAWETVASRTDEPTALAWRAEPPASPADPVDATAGPAWLKG